MWYKEQKSTDGGKTWVDTGVTFKSKKAVAEHIDKATPNGIVLLGPTSAELKAELDKRPHMPSKREGSALRRLRAIAGRTHGHADIL